MITRFYFKPKKKNYTLLLGFFFTIPGHLNLKLCNSNRLFDIKRVTKFKFAKKNSATID